MARYSDARPAAIPTISCSQSFPHWLRETGIGLGVTTYQTNRLFLLGVKDDGTLSAFERLFDGAMALHATAERLYLATRYQIWQFDNALAQDGRYRDFDRLYVPRVAHTTGELDVHDIAVDASGRVLFINTLYSCLATLDERQSFMPLWQPSFISALAPEDRCHLNGLALVDGNARYATAVSRSDTAGAWRAQRRQGGCVIEIPSSETICTDLSMPHSPRYYQDRLWLLNSGTGEFGYVDRARGMFEPVAFCPGYGRGLAFHKGHALVGLSKPRDNRLFTGLALDERLAAEGVEPRCGLRVIDLVTGEVLHWLDFEGVVTELYDVQILAGVRRPMALGFRSAEIRQLISFEHRGKRMLHECTVAAGAVGANGPIEPGTAAECRYETRVDRSVAQLIDQLNELSFPDLARQARARSLCEPLLTVTAESRNEPVGMIVAECPPTGDAARILSWFVAPAQRGRGIGSALLMQMQQAAKGVGAKHVEIAFRTDLPEARVIERILDRRGWGAPCPWMFIFTTTMDLMAQVPWLARCRLPKGYEIFSWRTLRAEERAAILERQKHQRWYPEVLSPFQHEDRIEPLNSVGLRYHGEIVGWLITHRTAPDTIQYTALFVRRDLQILGRGLLLIAAALRRQITSEIPKANCQVEAKRRVMLDYIRRRFGPYVASTRELRSSRLALTPAGGDARLAPKRPLPVEP
ncbi:MAG: TIGR03032 family protein [Gammaproteobacteria bacterium]